MNAETVMSKDMKEIAHHSWESKCPMVSQLVEQCKDLEDRQ